MPTIITPDAPPPIGPYSQGIACDKLIFTAGQIALEPDGTIVEGGVRAQTERVLRNLAAILKAGGASLNTVVKTTIFLLDMNDFAEVNAVYAEHFADSAPARSTVQVSRLPKDARVEIEAIAYVP